MCVFYKCFTCVLRRARFALFFGLAKGIVKHVLRQPGPRQSFGLAHVLAREPRPNGAFWGPEAPEPRRNRVIRHNHLLEFRSEVLSATYMRRPFRLHIYVLWRARPLKSLGLAAFIEGQPLPNAAFCTRSAEKHGRAE